MAGRSTVRPDQQLRHPAAERDPLDPREACVG
jgi:hypothetical protein